MARLPFDPTRLPSRADTPPADPSAAPSPTASSGKAARDTPPLTVVQACRLVKDVLATAMPRQVRIVGQVSNFSDRAHWFFSLKDDAAALRCVCFASVARKSRLPMADGLEVVVTGRFDIYDAQGNLQFYVDAIQPVGQGSLELQFRALCDELRKLGYFDPQAKKPLPVFPRRIAVVTSRAAAALQDVIDTAGRRWPGCELLLVDVRVQGASAAPEIARAIQALGKHGRRHRLDAVLVTRGGGSMEDLWAFNERIVADAIHRCPLPIVAAIGHETDTTIAELVADVRCATPTQAAMTLIPDRLTWEQQLDQHQRRLQLLTHRLMEQSADRLRHVARHAFFRQPDSMLQPWRQRLAPLAQRLDDALQRLARQRQDRLQGAARHLMALNPARQVRQHTRQLDTLAQRLAHATDRLAAQRRQQLDALARHLQAIGPGSVLQRGYTYTLDDAGKPITRAAEVQPGQAITTVFADGRVTSHTAPPGNTPAPGSHTAPGNAPAILPANGPSPAIPPSQVIGQRRRKPSPPPSADTPGLFD